VGSGCGTGRAMGRWGGPCGGAIVAAWRVVMKAIRVLPAKHEAPICEAYEDEREVRRFERAVREHRAYTEAFRVVPLDERSTGRIA
jgi:hypothetical protein